MRREGRGKGLRAFFDVVTESGSEVVKFLMLAGRPEDAHHARGLIFAEAEVDDLGVLREVAGPGRDELHFAVDFQARSDGIAI